MVCFLVELKHIPGEYEMILVYIASTKLKNTFVKFKNIYLSNISAGHMTFNQSDFQNAIM